MSINLQKGQRIDLVKSGDKLAKVMVGLGWDPVSQKEHKGFLSSLFGSSAPNIDCDASVLMLDENDKLDGINNVVYFGNLKSKCGSVQHTGDNLTGEGDGDDETILVELSKVPNYTNKLVFVVNIYDCIKRGQDFGMINNAYIRITNTLSKQELVRYNLSDDYSGKTSLIVGELYRYKDGWKFAAIGEGTNDSSLRAIAERYL
jgi:stress response protein SCP2